MMNKFKKELKITSILFLLAIFFSCSSSDDPGFTEEPLRTAADVRADFAALTINPGINDLTLESIIPGVFWKFRIIAPESASSSNKRPMVIRLHGGASAVSPAAHQSTGCLVEPGLAAIDAYIVSPNSNGSLWYEEENIIQVQALLDLVGNSLHVDLTKLVMMGYSDGGNGSFFYAQYFPGLFSAVIPMASSYATTSQGGVTHKFEDPIYAIHGSDDQLFPVETTQEYINDSNAVGSDISFIIANGLDHYNSCDYVSYLQGAAFWLENTVWD